ncbi:hypothetical protein [Haloferula sp. BvORR071]|uniref:hypothetical protein n=1 Tax=Haloferula sp. BvORR071 TaxID=1396141 RepID=UPI0005558A71|nr:hypothetical protein [Haloferula sp. BvORR071]
MGKAAILLISHLACIAAGGAWIRSSSASASDAAGNPAAAAKSGERIPRPASSTAADGSAMVERALSAAKPGPLAAESLAKLAAAYAPGDGEKAVRRLTEDGLSRPPSGDEFSAAFLAWFRDDPKAALLYVIKLEGMSDELLKLALAGIPLEEHLKLVLGLGRDQRWGHLGELLGTRLATLAPDDAATFYRSNIAGSENTFALRTLVRGWPNDAEGFLKFALAAGDVELIRSYLIGSGSSLQGSALLTLLDSRNDLPESIQKLLAEGGELRGHLYRYADPSVPLDKRIAEMANLEWLKDATPEKLREGALKQISTVDINELMRNGPDYRYAFRHGAMTADEILAEVKAKFPELAAASDYETRVRVFNELASEDAEAAFALISNLPQEERNLAVIHQSRWTFRDTSPDAFFAMINLAPGPDSSDAATQRADAWQNYGSSAYGRYGDYYVDWVRELPPGVNRDAARASLAAAARQRKNDALAKEFEKPASR